MRPLAATLRAADWLREHRWHTPAGPSEVRHADGSYTWTCPCAGAALTQAADGDDDGSGARRASGEVVCPHCHLRLARHPLSWHRSPDGDPFMHRLCDGGLVHL